MKTVITATCFVAALALQARAEETDPAIAGLEQTAGKFISAYNQKDAAALAALFTENGEITNLTGEDTISGREDIQAHYEEIFSDKNAPAIAIEVGSVRLVAPNLAIEDGVFHLTPPGDDETPVQSTTYTAAILKNDAGVWQIASSRGLKDVTDTSGHLTDLAEVLKGDWTCMTSDGVRMDLAFGWDPSGKAIAGEMLTTTSDGEPQPGTIRIGWDAARNSIVSWMFDSKGGTNQGIWTPADEGWIVRSEGTTADGEIITASQQLTPEGPNTLIWNVTNRVLDGEKQPDNNLRIVRQTPDAASN
jgi:uncharacterized protein (TIGR02246 family)